MFTGCRHATAAVLAEPKRIIGAAAACSCMLARAAAVRTTTGANVLVEDGKCVPCRHCRQHRPGSGTMQSARSMRTLTCAGARPSSTRSSVRAKARTENRCASMDGPRCRHSHGWPCAHRPSLPPASVHVQNPSLWSIWIESDTLAAPCLCVFATRL